MRHRRSEVAILCVFVHYIGISAAIRHINIPNYPRVYTPFRPVHVTLLKSLFCAQFYAHEAVISLAQQQISRSMDEHS